MKHPTRVGPIASCVLLALLGGCEAPAAHDSVPAPAVDSQPTMLADAAMTPGVRTLQASGDAGDDAGNSGRPARPDPIDIAVADAGAEPGLPSLDRPGDPDCSRAACREQASCYEPSGLACRCLVSAIAATTPCGELQLHSLGSPEHTVGWRAYSISCDGEVVVGRGDHDLVTEAVAWTRARGTRSTPSPFDDDMPEAVASADHGSIVLVRSHRLYDRGHSFLWRDMEVLEPFEVPPGGWVTDVSADGSVVIGSALIPDGGSSAFRWTAESGLVAIGEGSSNAAIATNASGSIVLLSPLGGSALWTAAGGQQLVPSDVVIAAFGDLSDDGSVLVGAYLDVPNVVRWPVRWSGAALEDLGTVGARSIDDSALAVSADGSVAVGISDGQAMIWTQSAGIRALRDVLAAQGVDVSAWVLQSAVGVSADGTAITGNALCEGRRVPYLAHVR